MRIKLLKGEESGIFSGENVSPSKEVEVKLPVNIAQFIKVLIFRLQVFCSFFYWKGNTCGYHQDSGKQ